MCIRKALYEIRPIHVKPRHSQITRKTSEIRLLLYSLLLIHKTNADFNPEQPTYASKEKVKEILTLIFEKETDHANSNKGLKHQLVECCVYRLNQLRKL